MKPLTKRNTRVSSQRPRNQIVTSINRAASILLFLFIGMHLALAGWVWVSAETWQDHVLIIDHSWQYKLLNPLAGQAIGFTLPILSIGYVNAEFAEQVGTDPVGIQIHEAKHIEQAATLGLIQYYQLNEWQREGIADYVRGGPTAGICSPAPNETANRLRYRDFYIVARYLVEDAGLSESEIYTYDSYPLQEAERWLQQYCT